MGNDLNLALALLLNNDIVAQVVGAALDLDGILEELLKGGDVEDLVVGRLLSVDDELPPLRQHANLTAQSHNVPRTAKKLTFLVCFWALPDFFYQDNDNLAYCTFHGAKYFKAARSSMDPVYAHHYPGPSSYNLDSIFIQSMVLTGREQRRKQEIHRPMGGIAPNSKAVCNVHTV